MWCVFKVYELDYLLIRLPLPNLTKVDICTLSIKFLTSYNLYYIIYIYMFKFGNKTLLDFKACVMCPIPNKEWFYNLEELESE